MIPTIDETLTAFFVWLDANIWLFQLVGILGAVTMAHYLIVQTSKATALALKTLEESKKESYEEAMSHYDGGEAAELDLSSGITLDDLLQSDGEIPDKFLGGR